LPQITLSKCKKSNQEKFEFNFLVSVIAELFAGVRFDAGEGTFYT